MATVTSQPNALRRALLLDAAASGGMGVLLLVAASSLESLLGLPLSLLRYAGAVLVPFAAIVVWVATRAHVLRGLAWTIFGANVLWTVASVLLLVSGLVVPTVLGGIFVLVQAAVVAGFAYLEYSGLRRAFVAPRRAT